MVSGAIVGGKRKNKRKKERWIGGGLCYFFGRFRFEGAGPDFIPASNLMVRGALNTK